jgi:hypothetical protein
MQITIWAGSDLYAIERVSLLNPQDVYQEVDRRPRPMLEQEFGMGVMLQQVDAHTYRINVDKVIQ